MTMFTKQKIETSQEPDTFSEFIRFIQAEGISDKVLQIYNQTPEESVFLRRLMSMAIRAFKEEQ